MGSLADRVLVVVPAHDEEHRLPIALAALDHAMAQALSAGEVDRAEVVVVAHRCTDATAQVARRHRWSAGVTALVVADSGSATVGEVRDHGVRSALGRGRALGLPSDTWLLSTDADSEVPADWVRGLLAVARTQQAQAVAGLVELVDWQASPAARRAYQRIVEAGVTGPDTHTHAYAANLAVRLDAYLAVGGFPAVAHGEEASLLAALVAAGRPIASTRGCVVRTSGRMPGRAAAGLGHLLQTLGDPAECLATEGV
ncbi:glycosyltransferase [Arsenicicoccus dermatophilus]|uniref:glycosyltransferase n=1 Tax=Arsenicicoccus dermatophilus TaxID=1076331 RepID=UPI0039175480